MSKRCPSIAAGRCDDSWRPAVPRTGDKLRVHAVLVGTGRVTALKLRMQAIETELIRKSREADQRRIALPQGIETGTGQPRREAAHPPSCLVRSENR